MRWDTCEPQHIFPFPLDQSLTISAREAYHSSLHLLDYLRAVVIACRYSIPEPLRHQTDAELQRSLVLAVAQTVLRHPLLHVGLAREDSKEPLWVRVDTVDLACHVQFLRDDDHSQTDDVFLQTVVQSQLNTRFPDLALRPGWRVAAWRTRDANYLQVAFAWNHANFDGMGAKIFHRDLLRELNRPRPEAMARLLDEHRILTVPPVPDARFPPPQETVEKYSVSPGFLLSAVWKELRPKAKVALPLVGSSGKATSRTSTDATWAPVQPSLPFKTLTSISSVDNAALQLILAACRAHETTLTGLLHAIVLVSLASQLGENKAPAFSSVTALDARHFTTPKPTAFPWFEPKSTMANYVTVASHEFDRSLVQAVRERMSRGVPPPSATSKDKQGTSPPDREMEDLIWSIGTRVRQEIQQKLDKGTHNDNTGLMKFVGDWRSQMKAHVTKPRGSAWNVSNLGVFTDDGDSLLNAAAPDGNVSGGGWAIEQAVFALGGEVPGSVFQIGVVSVRGKELCVAVSWQEGVVEAGLGEKLAADLRDWLRRIAAR